MSEIVLVSIFLVNVIYVDAMGNNPNRVTVKMKILLFLVGCLAHQRLFKNEILLKFFCSQLTQKIRSRDNMTQQILNTAHIMSKTKLLILEKQVDNENQPSNSYP